MKKLSTIRYVAITFFSAIIMALFIYANFVPLPEDEEVAEEPVIVKIVDPKQHACLATGIFYEARGETLLGQAAVARVIMNRVNHGFASNPCKVIYQTAMITRTNSDTGEEYRTKSCQFSWVCENKGQPNKNDAHYKSAERVAYDVLAHDAYVDIIPATALFFHNFSTNPMWPYHQVARIGNHIFYSKQIKKTKHQRYPKTLHTDA